MISVPQDHEAAASAGETWSPLVVLKAGDSGEPAVFCVHGAQGNVSLFASLAERMDSGRAFVAIKGRGADGLHPPDETIAAMALRYVEAIRAVQPSGPYVLAGYSGGGVIAYEMAQQLASAGQVTSVLFMIDALEPGELRRRITIADRLMHLHRIKAYRYITLPKVLWKYYAYPYICRKLGIVRPQKPLSPFQVAAQRVRAAYLAAQDQYEPADYYGDMIVVRADDARMHFLRSGPTLGWGKYVRGHIDALEVEGDHLSLFEEPAVSKLADRLRRALDEPVSARR